MEYQIKKGDTLSKIVMQQYGVKGTDVQKYYNEIAKLNGIKDPNLIFTGAKLKLPKDVFAPAQQADKLEGGVLKPETAAKNPASAEKFNIWLDQNTAEMDAMIEQYDSVLNKHPASKIKKMNDTQLQKAQQELTEANNRLLKGQEDVNKSTFNMIEIEGLIREDGTTNKVLYAQEGAKFAQSLAQYWEKDNEEGIDFEEYRGAEIARMNGLEVSDEAERLIEKAFDMMDLNDNDVIENSEIQSVYSVIDMADNKVDGKLTFGTYGNALEASTVIKEQAIKFQQDFLG